MNCLYLLILYNLAVFFVFGIDKLYAVKQHWRISEKALLLLCLIFGATGGMLGMIVFCHKTRKAKFRVLVPLFFVANTAAVYMLGKYTTII